MIGFQWNTYRSDNLIGSFKSRGIDQIPREVCTWGTEQKEEEEEEEEEKSKKKKKLLKVGRGITATYYYHLLLLLHKSRHVAPLDGAANGLN